MKHLKKITALVMILTLIVVCLALASCSTCEHEWGEWSDSTATCTEAGERTRTCNLCQQVETETVEAGHRYGDPIVKSAQSCTHDGITIKICELCNDVQSETVPATGHSGDDVCTTCGALTLGFEQLSPDFSAAESVLIRLENVSLEIDPESVDETEIAMLGNLSIELAELYLTLDGEELVGWGDTSVKLFGIDPTGESILEMKLYIEGDSMYYEASGVDAIMAVMHSDVLGDTLFGEVKLSAISDSNVNITPGEMGDIMGGFIDGSAGNLQIPTEILTAWIEEELAPLFTEVALDANIAKIEAALNKAIGELLVIEENDGGKTVTLDLSIIKEWNAELATMTVGGFIDGIMGEGFLAGIKANLGNILAFSVADFINYLTLVQGINVSELPATLDKLAEAVTEDESATFEELIGIEIDLEELLKDEDLLELSIGELLVESSGGLTVAELKMNLETLITALNSAPIYAMIGITDPTMIDQLVDMLTEMISYEIVIDSDGKFVSEQSSVIIPSELAGVGAAITESLTNEGMEINLDVLAEGIYAHMTMKVLVGYTSDVDISTYAAIKTKLEGLPEITEDILVELGYEVTKDQSGALIKAELLDKENGDYYLIDLSGGYLVSVVTEGCSGNMMVAYAFNGIREYREYTSEEEYELWYSGNEMLPVSIFFNPETDEIVSEDDFAHNHEETFNNFEEVACGETATIRTKCSKCEEVNETSFEKHHEYSYAITEISDGVYGEGAFCDSCGEGEIEVTLTVNSELLSFAGDQGIGEFIFVCDTPSHGSYTLTVAETTGQDVYIELYDYGTTPEDYSGWAGSTSGSGTVSYTGYMPIGTYLGVCVYNYSEEPVSLTLTFISQSTEL